MKYLIINYIGIIYFSIILYFSNSKKNTYISHNKHYITIAIMEYDFNKISANAKTFFLNLRRVLNLQNVNIKHILEEQIVLEDK